MGSCYSAATEPLIKFNIEKVDLKSDPAPEIIFRQLITNIKRSPLAYLFKIASLVKSNGRKNLEGILLLNQG